MSWHVVFHIKSLQNKKPKAEALLLPHRDVLYCILLRNVASSEEPCTMPQPTLFTLCIGQKREINFKENIGKILQYTPPHVHSVSG